MPAPLRIHITGNAGAGKTTLARQVSAACGLPLHHLDGIVWQPGWVATPRAQRDAAIAALAAEERWVIEGVSDVARHAADVVLVLDTPRWRCVLRCVRRCLRVGWGNRPELPDGCPELRMLFRAIRLAWRFPALAGRRIKDEAAERGYLVAGSADAALRMLADWLQDNNKDDLGAA